MEKLDWQEDANCASVGPEVFVITRNTLKTEIEYAKRVCLFCAVIDKCLEFSLQFDDDVIQGGRTLVERQEIRQFREEQL